MKHSILGVTAGERGRGLLTRSPPAGTGRLRAQHSSTSIRQWGAPERAVIGRDGKARTAAMAGAMARMRNAASVVEGSLIGCAALSPCW
jgi:hypothetical protein